MRTTTTDTADADGGLAWEGAATPGGEGAEMYRFGGRRWRVTLVPAVRDAGVDDAQYGWVVAVDTLAKRRGGREVARRRYHWNVALDGGPSKGGSHVAAVGRANRATGEALRDALRAAPDLFAAHVARYRVARVAALRRWIAARRRDIADHEAEIAALEATLASATTTTTEGT